MGDRKGVGLSREQSPSELLGIQARFPGQAAAPLSQLPAEWDSLHRTDPALTQCPPRSASGCQSRALIVLTSQDFRLWTLYHCILPRRFVPASLVRCHLPHLFLPFLKPNRAHRKTCCKKWPVPVLSPSGSFSLRAGLQALHLIKIRRHKHLASS